MNKAEMVFYLHPESAFSIEVPEEIAGAEGLKDWGGYNVIDPIDRDVDETQLPDLDVDVTNAAVIAFHVDSLGTPIGQRVMNLVWGTDKPVYVVSEHGGIVKQQLRPLDEADMEKAS